MVKLNALHCGIQHSPQCALWDTANAVGHLSILMHTENLHILHIIHTVKNMISMVACCSKYSQSLFLQDPLLPRVAEKLFHL